jgi:choline-glycine betaine transporter
MKNKIINIIRNVIYCFIASIATFLPLISGLIFHAKSWWWLLIITVQLIFIIIMALVLFGGLALGKVFSNNDGF